MSSGLSQEEIDALLRGEVPAGFGDDAAAAAEPEPAPEALPDMPGSAADHSFGSSVSLPGTEGMLTETEIDTLGEIGNISMGTAATTLFTLLSHKVEITTPKVTLTNMRAIAEEYPLPFVAVEVKYTFGLMGTNILFLREEDVKIITDLLMGGDGTNTSADLSELHLSAISEVMNQMVGSSSTSLAKLMGISIDISPPRAFQVNLAGDAAKVYEDIDEIFVRISFSMVVEGLINSEIMQVMPLQFAKDQVGRLISGGAAEAAGMAPAPAASPPPPQPAPQPAPQPQPAAPPPPPQQPQAPQGYEAPAPQPQPAPQPFAPQPQQPPYPPPYQDPYGGYPPQYPPQYQQPYPPQYAPQQPPPQYAPPPYQPPPQQMVDVHPANFGTFDQSGFGATVSGENMDLLLDVPLTVSVELGKSSKFIKEILDFNIGTIVVLDKMAG